MKNFFMKFRGKLSRSKDRFDIPEEAEEGYLEITPEDDKKSKIIVRPFMLKEFDDIKDILNSLREGYTIALIDIKPLKETDMIELKRAINKLKKTCDAIEGEIAGLGEDWIVVAPSFATIYKEKPEEPKEQRDYV